MPRLRWRLTKPELAKYARNAERLRRAGADFDASTFEMIDKPWISLECYPAASYVRATPTACLFVISPRLVALAPKVVIQEFEVSGPDWPLNAYVLDNPNFANPEVQLYRLLDRATFHRTGVLNHRTGAEGILRRGDVLEGSLLAESLVSVPPKYVDHSWMRLCISISKPVR